MIAPNHHGAICDVGLHCDTKTQQAIITDCHIDPNRDSSREKTPLSYARPSADPDISGKKAVISDDGIMPDVAATPHDHVFSNLYKRLDDISLQNKAMRADFLGFNIRLRMNKRRETVTARLTLTIALAPELVHARITDRAEQFHLVRRKYPFQAVPRDDR